MIAFLRTLLILMAPILIGWAFLRTLAVGIGRAFRHAWWEIRVEAYAIHGAWREIPERVKSNRKREAL